MFALLIACVWSLGGSPQTDEPPHLQATLLSLDHQHFPFVYLSVSVRRCDEGVSGIDQENFELTEDGISQSGNDSFEVVPPATGGGVRVVDIVFLMDNSGSMKDEQDAVRNHVSAFVDDLAGSGVDYQLGLCRFGASRDKGAPILEDSGGLTADLQYFKNTLWSRNQTRGSFEPGWDALCEAAWGFTFREGAHKVFILITDETPTDDRNRGSHTQAEAAAALQGRFITAFTLVELSDDYAIADYGTIAEQTNGTYYEILDPLEGILDYISAQIPDNYRIAYRSSNPVPDGTLRQVLVTLSDQGEEASCSGVYTPGSAPEIRRTTETLDLHDRAWAEGTQLEISAHISDAAPPDVQDATLFFRRTGDVTFNAKPMSLVSNDVWTSAIDPSTATPPGIDYYIQATDGSVTTTNPSITPRTSPHQLAILPNEAPAIDHEVATVEADNALQITATIIDSTNAVASATLHYRTIGKLTYQTSGEMKTGSSNTYHATIPGDAIGRTGVEYYICAQDDLGTASYSGTPDDPHIALPSSTDSWIRMTSPLDGEVITGTYVLAAETLPGLEALSVEFQFLHPGAGTWAPIGTSTSEPFQVGPFSYSQDDVGKSRAARAVALLDDGTTAVSEPVTFHFETSPVGQEIVFDAALNSGKHLAVLEGTTAKEATEFYGFEVGSDIQALEFYILQQGSDPAIVKVYSPDGDRVIESPGGKLGYWYPGGKGLDAYAKTYYCFARDTWEYTVNGKKVSCPAEHLASGTWSIAVQGGRFRVLVLATPQTEPGSLTTIRPISAYCSKYRGDGDYLQFYPFSGVIAVTTPRLDSILRKQRIPVWVDIIPDFGPTGPSLSSTRERMSIYDPSASFWVDLSKGDIPKGEFRAASPSSPFTLEFVGKGLLKKLITYLAGTPVPSLMLTMVEIIAKARYAVSSYAELSFFESGNQVAEISVELTPLVGGVNGCSGDRQEHSFALSFAVAADTIADDSLARQFMPTIYQLQCDAEEPSGNRVVEVGYQISGAGDLKKIRYNVVYRDEDEPNFDQTYDWYRHGKYGRTEDIEGFTVTANILTGTVEEIEFDGTWHNGWSYYDPAIVLHALPVVSEIVGATTSFAGTASFTKTNGHIDLYVGTWNHLYSDTSDVGDDAPCDDWVLGADASMEDAQFSNKSREELEAAYHSDVLNAFLDPIAEFSGRIVQDQLLRLGEFTVPTGVRALNSTLSWPGSTLDLILIDPRGRRVKPDDLDAEFREYPGLVIATVLEPKEGIWEAQAFGRTVPPGGTEYVASFTAEEAPEPPAPVEPHEANLGMLRFESSGPVDLVLRDPAAQIVSKEGAEVDGIVYAEGPDTDEITVPNRIVGDYEIRVVAEEGADRLERYDLTVTDGFDTVELADRKFIIHIPDEPYILRSTLDRFFDATGSSRAPAPPPEPEPREDRGPISTLTIILIAAGAVVLIGGIVGLILFLRSRYYI